MSTTIVCNLRNCRAPLTGVQRYTQELLQQAPDEVKAIAPPYPLSGVAGHLWEQCVLPFHSQGKTLWSPGNTGPLVVRNQVVTIHDLATIDHPEWFSRRFATWYNFLLPRLVQRVAHIITISHFTKQRLMEKCAVAEDHISVIPNGIAPSFTPQDTSTIQRMRERLKIPSEHYLLAIGSLEQRKNIDRQLSVWRNIQNDVPNDLWLVLFGGTATSSIFRHTQPHNIPPRVHVLGYVPDDVLAPLYAGATVFLYLSMYEGFGLPVLEAMASGTPVLTSNLTALTEVASDSAICVDPYHEDEIASALLTLIRDTSLRATLSEKGRTHSARFSWEKSAHMTFKVLKAFS
ncbi:MAG: mannosyltransferase [Nitrospiraceae bacterium]|nr:mannosyltransferase [Nitrospiraceae bacterium]